MSQDSNRNDNKVASDIKKNKSNLKNTRDKRKRVNRIKYGIIITIAISILVALISVICLIVSVVKINSRLNKIEEGTSAKTGADEVTLVNSNANANVIPPDSNEKTNVYLTFDDGPSDNTDSILDTLARYNVKATFFLVAKDDQPSKDKIKRIASEGHSIGIHSFSHKYSEIYSSLDAFKNDVSSMVEYLEPIIGYKPKLYRFPGGSSNKVTNVDIQDCISYINSQGMKYYDWNVSSGDAVSNAYTPDELVENVMKDVLKYKTSVVLLHDANAKGATAEALPGLIEALQAANVNILPITDSTPLVQHVEAK
ncbi:MAG TPA: polysaccharide deacetylase [Lachnospiraceae bacterium]|nr:polysaccharide deacetylase [Lachnospiraceae bacterium]